MKSQGTAHAVIKRHVGPQPLAAPTVSNGNAGVATNVVFGVARHKHPMNASFFVAHGRPPQDGFPKTERYLPRSVDHKKAAGDAPVTASNPKPLLLRADNFTPPSRTPWGGTKLRKTLKRDVAIAEDKARFSVVGESWEVSVEPDFPSVDATNGFSLQSHIEHAPNEWLGREQKAGKASTALLVKIIDAADELSVQIHPSDDYTGLHDGESGKPESWYVVEREEGAGIYLGLAEHATRDSVARTLAREGDVSKELQFIPVDVGDFFLIEAGTAHAIGRGLVLVEPQHVSPGKRGVTYRYWDWNRRYDKTGKLDPAGSPRPLHVSDALAVTNWDGARGDAFLSRARVRAGTPDLNGAPTLLSLAGNAPGLPSRHLEVWRLAGHGEFALPRVEALRSVTVLEGEFALTVGGQELAAKRGQSLVLPASLPETQTRLDHAHVILSAIP